MATDSNMIRFLTLGRMGKFNGETINGPKGLGTIKGVYIDLKWSVTVKWTPRGAAMCQDWTFHLDTSELVETEGMSNFQVRPPGQQLWVMNFRPLTIPPAGH